jgi:hypothetical protein
MAKRLEADAGPTPKFRYGSFVERYPDYTSWLDGSVWELDLVEDIREPLHNFRASLYYQARELGLSLHTKTITNVDGRRALVIQATAK